EAPRLLGKMARPAEDIGHELPLVLSNQLGSGARLVRGPVVGLFQVVEDGAQVAVQAGGAGLGVGRVVLVILSERVMNAADVLVELGRSYERLAEPGHRAS